MQTEINSDQMVIISDLHIGNPFCTAKRQVINFLEHFVQAGYDICINGDIFEIAQVSIARIAQDVPEVLSSLRRCAKSGAKIYYIIGNHDIVLENFFADWGPFKILPFANIHSGNQRIRIEHGHLYDPFFVKYPFTYEFLTKSSGIPLNLCPSLYKLYMNIEKYINNIKKKHSKGISGEKIEFSWAAYELIRRGFDTVIFGHTHRIGKLEIEPGKFYFNPGSWMINSNYVEINSGTIELKTWNP